MAMSGFRRWALRNWSRSFASVGALLLCNLSMRESNMRKRVGGFA